ncbi:hypothetical protein GPJ56_001202 [Histomonas meleagridis]|nr:hypothetical protein GPJ56_001202 [Histomonas meleagridis]
MVSTLFRTVIDWFKKGNPPPPTHKKSMAIMIGLLVFGFAFVTIWASSVLDIGPFSTVNSPSSLAFCSFITLCPGLYALWITICCWRGVKGYDWGMIPFFD